MRAALAFAALLAIGCEATATEIVVVVDSDLVAGTELTDVVVATDGASHQFPIDDAADLPLTFSVVPGLGQSDRATVRISITGLNAGGVPLVEALAVTTFRPDQRRVLPIPLARSCIVLEDCPDHGGDSTCRDGECVSAMVDSSTLGRGDGSGVRLFDGPSEGDAGIAVDDGGPACEPGGSCEVSAGCAVGTQVCDPAPDCVDLTSMPAGTECGDGRFCDGMGMCGR
ncbi:MAG: hypothetical protein JJ863_11245 [Deltaproteobacteria bacterium]|nr:hypothetical protein [Deltaproteobacteria bacterium]